MKSTVTSNQVPTKQQLRQQEKEAQKEREEKEEYELIAD